MREDYRFICDIVDENRDIILNAYEYIWAHPEVGYKEWKTSEYLEREFERLGYTVYTTRGIPGFIADLDTGREGPKAAVMGELDGLFCPNHPEANKETGAVHACGHCIQTSVMLGAAAALKEEAVLGRLSGSVRFVAVPAEETIDLEYRGELIKNGIIKYVAGKIEFLYRGMFDDVDMAIMFHADSSPDKLFKIIDGCDGCITKHIEYEGLAAHAGGAPEKGINALYAATLGINGCNALRETFKERDYVRYHPIITSGGQAANVIPDLVKMDTYVRAATMRKMLETNVKINRVLAASAAAMGARVNIKDKHGNLPFHSDRIMNRLFSDIMEDIFGEDVIEYLGWDTQSSDIGDLSTVIPVIQPLCCGAVGNQHGEDYYIEDKEKCLINPTKVVSVLVYELLKDGGVMANRFKESYKPLYDSKEDYFKTIDAIEFGKELVHYNEDGSITLDFHNPALH
ncbi:MAG: amidohydrolase [Clostridiales bacterium]|nr:amidohydrolase [Clostridiales bacterium]